MIHESYSIELSILRYSFIKASALKVRGIVHRKIIHINFCKLLCRNDFRWTISRTFKAGGVISWIILAGLITPTEHDSLIINPLEHYFREHAFTKKYFFWKFIYYIWNTFLIETLFQLDFGTFGTLFWRVFGTLESLISWILSPFGFIPVFIP